MHAFLTVMSVAIIKHRLQRNQCIIDLCSLTFYYWIPATAHIPFNEVVFRFDKVVFLTACTLCVTSTNTLSIMVEERHHNFHSFFHFDRESINHRLRMFIAKVLNRVECQVMLRLYKCSGRMPEHKSTLYEQNSVETWLNMASTTQK